MNLRHDPRHVPKPQLFHMTKAATQGFYVRITWKGYQRISALEHQIANGRCGREQAAIVERNYSLFIQCLVGIKSVRNRLANVMPAVNEDKVKLFAASSGCI